MKFFTPERYLRLGNLADERTFLAAQEDWEQAVQRYRDHLGRVGKALPARLRRLVGTVCLHDARVLDMWQDGGRRLTVTLLPESEPARLVVLAYSLAGPPRVERGVLPPERCSEPVAWLYDELGVSRTTDGKTRTFTHDILLSNGWEMRLRFHRVGVSRPHALLPAEPDERSASRSA
jgi:hypothetical protein